MLPDMKELKNVIKVIDTSIIEKVLNVYMNADSETAICIIQNPEV